MFSTEDRTETDDAKFAPRPAETESETDPAQADTARVDLDAQDAPEPDGEAHAALPRVLYIDMDDDLAALLDRVEGTGTPAIVVLPEGALAVRGMVSARLLKRRADAAGIVLAAVTTGRVTVAQFTGVGIPCAPTVGEARLKLSRILQASRQTGKRGFGATSMSPFADSSKPRLSAAVGGAAVPALDPTLPRQVDSSPLLEFSEEDEPDSSSSINADSVDQPADVQPAAASTVVPPRSGSPPGKARHRLRRGIYVFIAAVLALLLALGTWIVFFPSATITISYAARRFDRTYLVPLGTVGAGAIPLYHTELSKKASVGVLGTGTRLVPGAHAVGVITFANQEDGYVLVPAGTVVDAQDGSRYATIADVRVPAAVHSFAGTTNGQQSVSVRAILGGTSSNSPQGAVVTIEGRLAGVLLVTNYAAISGGAMRTEYSVTAADIAGAAARLDRQLAQSETATLNKTYSLSPIRLIGAIQVSAPQTKAYTVNGRAAVRVLVTARVAMGYVHAADVRKAADAHRDRDLAGLNAQVTAGSERVTSTVVRSNGKTRGVTLRVQARTTPALDVANLRALLVGQSLADARRLLDGSAANGGWSYAISTTPGLADRLPQAAGLITIRVNERTGS